MSLDTSRRGFLALVGGATATVALPAEPQVFELVEGQAGAAVLGGAEKYPWRWWVSYNDGETFTCSFGSKEEALKEAGAQADDDQVVMVAECQRQDFRLCVNGDEIIELLYGKNEELMGEYGEFIDCTTDQVEELGRVVTEAIEAWAVRNKVDTAAWVFGVVRNKELVGGKEVIADALKVAAESDDIRDDPHYMKREPDPWKRLPWGKEDPIVVSRAGAERARVTHARLMEVSGWVAVTRENYPAVFEAFESVSHDSGFGAGHTNYAVPEQLKDQLPIAERGLLALTHDERQEFAIGEQTFADQLSQEQADLKVAHDLLSSFFDDWTVQK